MNMIIAISGLEGEGHREELIEMLASSIVQPDNWALGGDDVFIRNCSIDASKDLIKRELIDKHSMTEERADNLIEAEVTIKELDINDGADGLFKHINDSIIKSDCCIYIDLPELVDENFASNIEKFIDRFPNEECGNSMDIRISRTRK